MSETAKLLTIIVPSYNMEKYLPKCLGSLIVDDVELLQQLDVIVVNDGSTDCTSEIAHDFEQRYPGVFRVIDKPNGHYGSCINAALPLARGEYVRILDADDTLDTDILLDYLQILATCAEKQVDAVITDTVCVDETGTVLKTLGFPYIPQGESPFSALPSQIVKDFNLQAPFAYRTELLRQIQYRQTEGIPYTDAEWATLPFARVGNIRYFAAPLYRYLVGRDGQSMDRATVIKNFWMSARAALDCLRQSYAMSPAPEAANARYVQSRIELMLISTYQMAIFAVHTRESDSVLADLDEELHGLSPDMFNRVTRSGVAVKGLFPYVRIWRARHSSQNLLLRMFRVLRSVFLRSYE